VIKGLLLGIILTLAALCAAGYVYLHLGYFYLGADQKPTFAESTVAMGALDAATDRRSEDLKNPLPANETTITDGAQIYLNHCGGCHGVPSNPDSEFGKSFYPPVPAFFKAPPDMEEKPNFYIIKHGVRWTGMPAFGSTLNDTQLWQVVTFLSHIRTLPPAAKNVFDPHPAPPAAH